MSSRLHEQTQPGAGRGPSCLLFALTLLLPAPRMAGAESPAAAHFRSEIRPILAEYCFDCHADGMKKGKVAFDEFKSDEELLKFRRLHRSHTTPRRFSSPPHDQRR